MIFGSKRSEDAIRDLSISKILDLSFEAMTHLSLLGKKYLRFFAHVFFFFFLKVSHCVKSVRILSFSGPFFPAFGPEKPRIWTLFTQCQAPHVTKFQTKCTALFLIFLILLLRNSMKELSE